MSDAQNPFQSPATDSRVVGVRGGNVEDLQRIAFYQKGVLICIAIYLIGVFFRAALVETDATSLLLRAVVGLVLLADVLAGVVFVFLLAMKVYNPVIGVLLGILAIIPCVGLLVLLFVNAKATSVLRNNGIRVGFLGAKPPATNSSDT